MKDPRSEHSVAIQAPEFQERADGIKCQFVDGGTLGSSELKRLATLLEMNSVIHVVIGRENPTDWALGMQEYHASHSRELGPYPHAVVVLENVAKSPVLGRYVKSEESHIGFIVRSDYNPAFAYADCP